MKPDTERRNYYSEENHKKRNHLSMHLSKELQGKLKNKRRSLLARKDDTVRIMRGPGTGKEGRISKLSVVKRKAYVEGVATTNAKGREVLIALEPSNLMLKSLVSTDERKKLFSEGAFKKPEKKKTEAPKSTEKKAEEKKPETTGKGKSEESQKSDVKKPAEQKSVPEKKDSAKAEKKND